MSWKEGLKKGEISKSIDIILTDFNHGEEVLSERQSDMKFLDDSYQSDSELSFYRQVDQQI